MIEAILQSLSRGIFVIVLYGFSLAAAHALTLSDRLPLTRRKAAGRIQWAISAALALGVMGEAYILLNAGYHGHNQPFLDSVLAGTRPWCRLTWTMVAFPTLVGVCYFHVAYWRFYTSLRTRVREGSVTPDEADEQLTVLDEAFPPFLKPLLADLRHQVEHDRTKGATDGAGKAKEALLRNDCAAALKHMLAARPDATETLLLAEECGDYFQCRRLIDEPLSRVLRMEAAEMMADSNADGKFGELAVGWLAGREGSRRRAAVMEYRRGNRGDARRLLSEDWEARIWMKDEQTQGERRKE